MHKKSYGRAEPIPHTTAKGTLSGMPTIEQSCAPWLFIRDSLEAVQFYKDAVGVLETLSSESSRPARGAAGRRQVEASRLG
jgi:hypothetical protein